MKELYLLTILKSILSNAYNRQKGWIFLFLGACVSGFFLEANKIVAKTTFWTPLQARGDKVCRCFWNFKNVSNWEKNTKKTTHNTKVDALRSLSETQGGVFTRGSLPVCLPNKVDHLLVLFLCGGNFHTVIFRVLTNENLLTAISYDPSHIILVWNNELIREVFIHRMIRINCQSGSRARSIVNMHFLLPYRSETFCCFTVCIPSAITSTHSSLADEHTYDR